MTFFSLLDFKEILKCINKYDPPVCRPHAKRMSSGGGGGGGGAAAGGGSSGSGARKGSHDYEDDYADERNPSSRPLMKSSVISKNIKTRDDLIRLQNKFNGSEQRLAFLYVNETKKNRTNFIIKNY